MSIFRPASRPPRAAPPRAPRAFAPRAVLTALASIAAVLAGAASALFALPPLTPPQPSREQVVTTVLSLIRFKHSSCDRIAGRLLDQWQRAGGSLEAQEEKVRDYILRSELSDLAASRAAADVVARFLPRVKAEVNLETHGTMTRLDAAVTSLCDTVALPTGPLDAFRRRLSEVLDRIDRETKELGRLLVIPDAAVLEAAIEPYLEAIQLAGLAAESEYQEYLESLRPKARKATFAELVQQWHAEVYLPAVAPSKAAWGKYLAAREKLDSKGMNAACRELSQALIPLLRDPTPFKGPDSKLDEPLRLIYVDLRAVATACTGGNATQMNRHWADFNGRLQSVSEALQRYGLQP